MEFQHSNIPVFYDSIIPLLQHSSLRFRISIFEFRISTFKTRIGPKSNIQGSWIRVWSYKICAHKEEVICLRFERFRGSLYYFWSWG